jgi:CRISPR-associated protein Cmr2
MTPTTGTAFFSFSLGPVQSFIATARTVRDLWTGSYLLSWLTFQAMGPIIEKLGIDAFVSPVLDQNPLLHFYYPHLWKGEKPPEEQDLLSPCLPNRFLVEIPEAQAADDFAVRCERTCREAWERLCAGDVGESLTNEVETKLARFASDWKRKIKDKTIWAEQVGSFFEVRTAVLPWAECDAPAVNRLLAEKLPVGASADALWTARWQVLGGLIDARRTVRHVPLYHPPDRVPPKCSLMGTYEQMGPPGLDDSGVFWKDFAAKVRVGGTRTRTTERLCAVSLVKRFAWPAFIAPHFKNLDLQLLRFADTATAAAADWLKADPDKGTPALHPASVRKKSGRWSGQWLHWVEPSQDREEEPVPTETNFTPDGKSVWDIIKKKKEAQGKPPTYYAILMIDGDNMGDWLRGKEGKSGPRRHRQISQALARFALQIVPGIVRPVGELIYAGGDDVLALLPTATALKCAHEISKAFQANWPDELQKEGAATVSAGVAVVHHKDDLRFALDTARRAEKQAKDGGRDAVQITVCRRSGEHSSTLCPWAYLDTLEGWVQAFVAGASDRWAYHLAADLPTLRGLEDEAVQGEIRRQVNRAETLTRSRLGETKDCSAGERLGRAFGQYRDLMTHPDPQKRRLPKTKVLEQFIGLCQTASFLARGRDA